MARRFLLWLWLALAGLHVALGVTWAARNFNTVPDYGDTGDYLQLARTLKVDAYRGIGYPAFLAGVNRLPGGGGLMRGAGGKDKFRGGVIYLQSLQWLAALGALAYWTRVCLAPLRPGPGARGLALLLWLLLLLDPLVAHFGMAVMTDSLALSGTLLFTAALTHFGLGERRRLWAGCLLGVAAFATSALRVEKLAVLGCATLATFAAWRFLERGLPAPERRFTWRRAAAAGAIVLVAGLGVQSLHRGAKVDGKRWPLVDSLLHSRIVFPNLSKVYEELSPEIQKKISKRDAKKHDSDSILGFRIVNDATGASGPTRRQDREEAKRTGKRPSVEAERRALLADVARVVWRERKAAILLDTAKDALENVLATGSFFVRLALLARHGDVSVADGTQKTYETLAQRRPEHSRWYVVSSVVLVLTSACLALPHLLRRRADGRPRVERRLVLAWVPIAAVVVVNACAFALRADMVHIRYMLLAHTAFVALALRGALAWLCPGSPASGGAAQREDQEPAPGSPASLPVSAAT